MQTTLEVPVAPITVDLVESAPAPVPLWEAPAKPARDTAVGWTITLSSLAVFLIALEITIISVALPLIAVEFAGTDRATLSWIFTAYNVGVASLLLISGWTAERLGRKQIFLVGMVVFGIGSVMSGLAPTIEILIVGRVVQSIGGAMLLPSSLALILHSVAADRRDMAIGVWGAMAGVAAALGPTLGSLLIEYAGWRWVFLINVPIAVIALAGGSIKLIETRDPDAPKKADVVAVPLGAVGVGLLVFAITEAGRLGLTDRLVLLPLVGSAVLLAVFAYRSTNHPNPLFPPDLARYRSFSVGAAATITFSAAFSGWLVLAPSFLVEHWDYTVLRAGFAIAPAPLAMAITAGPAGKLSAKLGHRTVITVGSLLPAVAVIMWISMIGSEPAYLTSFVPGAILLGIGLGIGFPMLTAASMRDVESRRYAIGAAGNTTLRQVSVALGISLAVAIVGSSTSVVDSLAAYHWSWGVCGWLFAATSLIIGLWYPSTNRPIERF